MNPRDLDLALESATSAYRTLDRDGRLVPPPSWFDLPLEALDTLHRRQSAARELERTLHPDGLSSTVLAVLQRLGLR